MPDLYPWIVGFQSWLGREASKPGSYQSGDVSQIESGLDAQGFLGTVDTLRAPLLWLTLITHSLVLCGLSEARPLFQYLSNAHALVMGMSFNA